LEGWWEKRKEENPYLAEASINNLEKKIQTIKDKGFDYCFIDTPGDTSLNTTETIKIADMVVIPCKPTSPDLKAIGRTISMVQEDNKNFLFLLSQTIANSKAATQAAMILSEFGTLITSSVSNRISYVNAMAIGDSATNLDTKAAEELAIIWKFLETRLNNNKDQKNDKEKI
jgi:chromosome partitioning protein